MLLITAVCSCVFLASTSQNRIMRNVASVSDYAHQIGSVSCVVAADMFLTGAQEIIAGFSSDESGYPILTSSGGNIIIHSDSALMPWVDDHGNEHFTEYSSTVRNVSGSTTDNGTTTCTLTDHDGVARCEISADIPAAGWKFSYAMNSSELTHDVTNIIIIFGVLIPVIITAAAIVCTIVVKRCFRPLAAVSAAAQRMTHGLSVKFDYMADDEIGSGAENVSNGASGASDLAETSSKQTALVDEISTDVNSADEIISNNVSLTGNARQLSDNTSAANAEESAAAAAELDSQAARLREMTEKFKVRPNPPCQRYGGYFYMPGAEYLELPKAEGLRPPLFLICLSDYSSMDFSSVSRSVKAPTRSLRVCA